MIQNRKKAFIDQIMLGFFLIAFTTIFIGTVSDELQARNKYTQLKKVAQTAVLTAAKYYLTEENDEESAENIALSLIEEIPLGDEIKDDIVFVWDFDAEPNTLIATIPEYTEEFFWFKLLDFNHINFINISAKVNILNQSIEDAEDFVPIAVNGCTQELQSGQDYDFLYKTFDLFDVNDNMAFYGLSDSHNLKSQASFAHFKNAVGSVVKNHGTNMMNVHHIMETIVTTESDKIENDIKQISQQFDIKNFAGQNMTIALLECNSTASDPVIKELVPIHMNAVYCAKACCKISFMGAFSFGGCSWFMSFMCTIFNMMTNITADVFDTSNFWTTGQTASCNQANFFRINFEILTNTKVQLEY